MFNGIGFVSNRATLLERCIFFFRSVAISSSSFWISSSLSTIICVCTKSEGAVVTRELVLKVLDAEQSSTILGLTEDFALAAVSITGLEEIDVDFSSVLGVAEFCSSDFTMIFVRYPEGLLAKVLAMISRTFAEQENKMDSHYCHQTLTLKTLRHLRFNAM